MVVVSPTVGIYSVAENDSEGTPGYTVAVVAAEVDNNLNFGP